MIVVVLLHEAVARTDNFGQSARILHVSTSIFAFFATVEIVSIALAAAVYKLFADTLSAVVEPFGVFLRTRAVLVRKEAEVGSKFDFSRWRGGSDSSLASVNTILFGVEIILVPTAATVVELSALLLVRVVVPSLGIIVAFSQKRGQETGILLFHRAALLTSSSRTESISIAFATAVKKLATRLTRGVIMPA